MSQKLSRRELLKLLAAATGATIISSVPNKWVTPIVEFGALPAHAQGSATGSIRVIFDTTDHPTNANAPKTIGLTVNITLKNQATILYSQIFVNFGTVVFNSVPPGTYTASWSGVTCVNPASPKDITVLANQQATLNLIPAACP